MAANDLYTVALGTNPNARPLVALLREWNGGNLVEFPRWRDAWLDYVSPGEPAIVVLTRTGGPNRPSYERENQAVRKHPLFIHDADDDFDKTYAYWWFRIPTDHKSLLLQELVRIGPPQTMKLRFEEAIAKIEAGGPIPDLSGMTVIRGDGTTTTLADLMGTQA